MGTRKELTSTLAQRYRESNRVEKGRILDEFVGLTGFHRKHATRLLRGALIELAPVRRARRAVYEEAERNALTLLWEAADRVCGKRLKALLPALLDSMERHERGLRTPTRPPARRFYIDFIRGSGARSSSTLQPGPAPPIACCYICALGRIKRRYSNCDWMKG